MSAYFCHGCQCLKDGDEVGFNTLVDDSNPEVIKVYEFCDDCIDDMMTVDLNTPVGGKEINP